jgi:hypothetical protein
MEPLKLGGTMRSIPLREEDRADHNPNRPTWEQSPRAAEYAKNIPHDQRANITSDEFICLIADVESLRAQITRLESQRDGLLAACKAKNEAMLQLIRTAELLDDYCMGGVPPMPLNDIRDIGNNGANLARAAIAACEEDAKGGREVNKVSIVYVEEISVRPKSSRSTGEHHTTIERELGSPVVKLRTSNGHTVHVSADALKKAVAAI